MSLPRRGHDNGRHQTRARPTLVYDGDCGFCAKVARFIERRSDHRFDVVPSHSLDLEAVGLTFDDVSRAAWWLEPGRPPQGGHDSIAASLRAATMPWSIGGRLLALPGIRTLGRRLYPIIARNRHRLPGATDACAVDLSPDD
ncbi:MAG: DUF393 domain-containing protein [Actinomycetia bacterium]|nr:DUF393 domain-containing protein [Actinomycetes bacterium]